MFTNTTAEFVASKDQVKDLLGKQVYSSVRLGTIYT